MFQMLEVSKALLAANIPIKWESLPGAGKTSLLNALGRASGGFIHTMVGVTHDPTDFGGVPYPVPDAGYYDLLPGKWAVDLAEACNDHPLVIAFLDEANTAGRAVLAAELKLVDEKRVGNYPLPGTVRIVMAVNPAEANGGVDLPPAMANRVAHVPFEYPLDLWLEGLEQGFPDPAPLNLPDDDAVDTEARRFAQLVARFLRQNPSLVARYPEQASERSSAFPTRRTWTLGTRAMAGSSLIGTGEAIGLEALATLVGHREADLFADWSEAERSIDVEAAFSDPMGYPLPTSDDALFATLGRLAEVGRERAMNGDTAPLDAACRIMVRVSTELQRPGIAASAVRDTAVFLKGRRDLMTDGVRAALQEFRPVIQQLEGGN